MRGRSPGARWGVVLEAPDARELARFYTELLEWRVVTDSPGWVVLSPPGGGATLSFQSSAEYVAPVWPAAPDHQQMQAHLDLEVEDLDAAVDAAVDAGATTAAFQPQQSVRVMLDPVGHPFCLYVEE